MQSVREPVNPLKRRNRLPMFHHLLFPQNHLHLLLPQNHAPSVSSIVFKALTVFKRFSTLLKVPSPLVPFQPVSESSDHSSFHHLLSDLSPIRFQSKNQDKNQSINSTNFNLIGGCDKHSILINVCLISAINVSLISAVNVSSISDCILCRYFVA